MCLQYKICIPVVLYVLLTHYAAPSDFCFQAPCINPLYYYYYYYYYYLLCIGPIYVHQRKYIKLKFLCNAELRHKCHKNAIFTDFVSRPIQCKTGTNYPDLEPGDKFWNRVTTAFPQIVCNVTQPNVALAVYVQRWSQTTIPSNLLEVLPVLDNYVYDQELR